MRRGLNIIVCHPEHPVILYPDVMRIDLKGDFKFRLVMKDGSTATFQDPLYSWHVAKNNEIIKR